MANPLIYVGDNDVADRYSSFCNEYCCGRVSVDVFNDQTGRRRRNIRPETLRQKDLNRLLLLESDHVSDPPKGLCSQVLDRGVANGYLIMAIRHPFFGFGRQIFLKSCNGNIV